MNDPAMENHHPQLVDEGGHTGPALFGMGCFVLWAHTRVDEDFLKLKPLLTDTRHQAVKNNETLVARLVDKQVVITNKKTDTVISNLNISTLAGVNHDTNIGDDMIVLDGHGTSAYNKKIHGGDLRLKSWLGFRTNIAVNCTGLVTEGVSPAEGDQ